MKKALFATSVGFFISAIILCFIFYGWQLFLILTLFFWGNNLFQENKKY